MFSGGIVSQSWANVELVLDTNLAKLARGTLHASTFETGFHEEDNTDQRRYSIGTYINPDTTFDFLIDYALSEGTDAVIFAGDAYKSREPTQTQQREFARRVRRLAVRIVVGAPTLWGKHEAC